MFGSNVYVDLIIMDHAKDLYQGDNALPKPATSGSGAIDLIAAENAYIQPGQTVPVSTGLRFHMRDANVAAVVLPRSGLGAKHGLVLGNLVGFIDNDYQGEILCFMWNRNFLHNGVPNLLKGIPIKRGERFAQLAFIPFLSPKFNLITEKEFTNLTDRGSGGFGSTGS